VNKYWSSKKVLVTGAGGFIGSHLVEQLVVNGANVKAFIHYNSRRDPGMLAFLPEELLSRVELIPGDLRDQSALRDAMKRCLVVFHLGATISIPYSYLHPDEVVETNILGTLNVLSACRDLGVRRLVHTSSSEVYGTARKVPIPEEHQLQAQSPYSASKIAADKLAESFYCSYDLPVVTVRPFNTYGPRQSARAVIPAIISQALMFDAIHLGNTDTSRDFTFIDDTVAGLLAAGQVDHVEGKVFNLGTGEAIKIGDLAEKILRKIGKTCVIKNDHQRLRPPKSEVQQLVSDNRLAGDVLGWQPKFTFDQGLDLTIKWITENLHRFQADKYLF
jgi:NAD dependent epimerase/dehydratase